MRASVDLPEPELANESEGFSAGDRKVDVVDRG